MYKFNYIFSFEHFKKGRGTKTWKICSCSFRQKINIKVKNEKNDNVKNEINFDLTENVSATLLAIMAACVEYAKQLLWHCFVDNILELSAWGIFALLQSYN